MKSRHVGGRGEVPPGCSVSAFAGRWFTLAHLCGYFPSLGSRKQVEMDLAQLQNYDLTLQDQPVIQNGHVVLTDRPGIGLEVNDEALRRYLRPGTGLFEVEG